MMTDRDTWHDVFTATDDYLEALEYLAHEGACLYCSRADVHPFEFVSAADALADWILVIMISGGGDA